MIGTSMIRVESWVSSFSSFSAVWSNALLELAQQGLPCPPITPQMLRKYVAWRYRLGMQPA